METKIKTQFNISKHQVALIAVVFIVLGGVVVVRSPEKIKQLFKHDEQTAYIPLRDRPEYRKFFEPQQPDQEVLGASTATDEQQEGNMIIGEDGQLHSVDELGEVLGASTETIDTNLDNIQIKVGDDNSQKAVDDYMNTTIKWEGEVLDGAALETALTTDDEVTINKFIEQVNTLEEKLEFMSVPRAVTKLHKLKILQFRAVASLLKNYIDLETNPEQVAQDFEIFLKVQSDQDEEIRKIRAL